MSSSTSRALLLDLDGTLADSLGVMRKAYAMLLSEHSRRPSDEEFDRLNGPPLAECARRLRQAHDLAPSVDMLVARWFELIAKEYLEVRPAVGAAELLRAAKDARWLTAVVTSNGEALASRWLAAAGLADLIDDVVGGAAVSRGKPAPDPYLEAMRRLRVEPGRCVAVEDSPVGAQAAQAAGALTFGLANACAGPWPAGVQPVASLRALVQLMI